MKPAPTTTHTCTVSPTLLVCAEEVIQGTSVLRGRETWGIDHAHMAPDGVDNASRMRQRAHMTGACNLVVAGMGQSLAEDIDHAPRRRASAPAADEQRRSLDPSDRIKIILRRKHEPPLGRDLDR